MLCKRCVDFGSSISVLHNVVCSRLSHCSSFKITDSFEFQCHSHQRTHLLTHCLILQVKPLTQSLVHLSTVSVTQWPSCHLSHSLSHHQLTHRLTHSFNHPATPTYPLIHSSTHSSQYIHSPLLTYRLSDSLSISSAKKYTSTYRFTHQATDSSTHWLIHSPTHWSRSTTNSVLSNLRRVYFEDPEVNFQALAVVRACTATPLHPCTPAPQYIVLMRVLLIELLSRKTMRGVVYWLICLEILVAVTMLIAAIWNVTSCSPVNVHRRVGETYCLYLWYTRLNGFKSQKMVSSLMHLFVQVVSSDNPEVEIVFS
jgi:hypothetical protein